MVLADASEHDWLEGRGPMLTLVGMIDDATDRIILRFCEVETTESYMEVLGRWLRRFGRPVSWYSDRHGIFRAEEMVKGYDEKRSVPTQFSRALDELGIELILANSPQAKGRVERLWGTAQDRLVKELRLSGAATIEQANEVPEKRFMPWFNRHCTHEPAGGSDVHRSIEGLDLEAILCHQEKRVVANDYTIRFENRVYQLLPPALPGERGGRVTVEKRRDGEIRVRFKRSYLPWATRGMAEGIEDGKAAPSRSLAPEPIPVRERKKKDPARKGAGSIAEASPTATVHRSGRRSGRTPALPCPPAGTKVVKPKVAWRPASTHPWRRSATTDNRTFLSGGNTGHF